MSRIGKLPVPVPSGVDVQVQASTVTVKGPKGTLSHTVAAPITVAFGTHVEQRLDIAAVRVVRHQRVVVREQHRVEVEPLEPAHVHRRDSHAMAGNADRA